MSSVEQHSLKPVLRMIRELTESFAEMASTVQSVSCSLSGLPEMIDEEPRNICFGCGEPARADRDGRKWAFYFCACGCTWTDRDLYVDPDEDLMHVILRDQAISQTYRMPMVDFTKPGALSSPA